jgi:hypothetical protein
MLQNGTRNLRNQHTAHIDEMTIENRMVELYHAHTDEDTKLSRHIYSNTLGITIWPEE